MTSLHNSKLYKSKLDIVAREASKKIVARKEKGVKGPDCRLTTVLDIKDIITGQHVYWLGSRGIEYKQRMEVKFQWLCQRSSVVKR